MPVFTSSVSVSRTYVKTFSGSNASDGDKLTIAGDGSYKVGNVRKSQDGLLLTRGLVTVNR